MADEEVVTLTVRGEGGDTFAMDLPPEGSWRRENFDYMVSKGLLEIVDGTIPATAPEPPPGPELPDELVDIDLETLDRDQLLAVAAARGVAVHANTGAEKLRTILTDALGE